MDFITLATSVKADTSLPFTATVIIAGLGIVLCTLAILVLVFKGFGAVISKTQNKSKKSKNDTNKAQPAPAVAKKTAPTATAANSGVSEEIVAAISAGLCNGRQRCRCHIRYAGCFGCSSNQESKSD